MAITKRLRRAPEETNLRDDPEEEGLARLWKISRKQRADNKMRRKG
jgi:hypothetical protein